MRLTDTKTSEEQISTAKQRMIMGGGKLPFFGLCSLKLRYTSDPTCKTAWTDGTTVGYNADYVKTLTGKQTIGLVAHEVYHSALRHPFRLKGRNPEIANIAADYVANRDLKLAGIELPPGALECPEEFKTASFERIYATIMERERQDPQQKQNRPDTSMTSEIRPPKGQEGSPHKDPSPKKKEDDKSSKNKSDDSDSDESDDSGDSDSGDDESNDSGDNDSEGSESSDDESDDNDSGSGSSDDEDEESEDESDGSGSSDDSDDDSDSPIIGDEDFPQMTETDWQVAVEQIAAICNKAGSLPAGVDINVKAAREREPEALEVLRQFVDNTIASRADWTTPNRRFISQGIYLPGMRKENMPRIAVLVDVSDSIYRNKGLLTFFGELMTHILKEYKPESMDVYYCDTEIRKTETFSPDDPELIIDGVSINTQGGGGTAFKDVFDVIEESQDYPACMVVLTDLEVPFTEPVRTEDGYSVDWSFLPKAMSEPEYPVLFVTTFASKYIAPWGETLRVDDKQ